MEFQQRAGAAGREAAFSATRQERIVVIPFFLTKRGIKGAACFVNGVGNC